jgi:hypothetical protein
MMLALFSSFACERSQQQTRPSPPVASVRAAAVYPKYHCSLGSMFHLHFQPIQRVRNVGPSSVFARIRKPLVTVLMVFSLLTYSTKTYVAFDDISSSVCRSVGLSVCLIFSFGGCYLFFFFGQSFDLASFAFANGQPTVYSRVPPSFPPQEKETHH